MRELKTKRNARSVARFLMSVKDRKRREECKIILKLIQQVTKTKPEMWGTSIIGFGSYHYRYASGREGDWFLTGFSPRKQNLTLYLMSGMRGHNDLLKRLGKHKTGKGCLYVNNLADIDKNVLKQLIEESLAATRARRYESG